jgi:hypothetical protein
MVLSPLRAALVAVLALPLIPLIHCTGTATTPPSSAEIGPAGGSLASSDYAIEITVPPGAIPAPLNFTITPTTSTPGDGGIPIAAPSYQIAACSIDGGICDGVQSFSSPTTRPITA